MATGLAGKIAVIAPKHLVAYNQCSLRHHLMYRRRLRGDFRPDRSMAEGNALHHVMRRWFRSTSDWRAGADPTVISRWLREELVESHYELPADHLVAMRSVADHAAWCLDQIPSDVAVRLSEKDVQSTPVRIGDHPVRFQARVDLIVQHPDGEIEHIDFKTGGPQEDHWIQRGVERLVVGAAHPAGAGRPATRTTTLYAGPRLADSQCHTVESFQATRAELRDLAHRMLTDDAPQPTPSGRCAWCAFREAGCPVGGSETRSPGAGPRMPPDGVVARVPARRPGARGVDAGLAGT